MRRPRLGLTLAAVAACLAVFVPSAAAIDPFPNTGIVTLSSKYFMVHFSRDDSSQACPTQFLTQERAGDVLGWADRAYEMYAGWGYTLPVLDTGDGDNLIDISIDEFDKPGSSCVSYGVIDPSIPMDSDGTYKRWDALINPVAPLGAGEIHLVATESRGLNFHIIAHEVFHLFELAMSPTADQWLQEGTAEWAAIRADSIVSGSEQNPDRTMDCVGAECGDTEFDKNGYPGWMLFEYLAERFGDGKIKALWQRAAASPPGTSGTSILEAELAPTTLASFFNDYAKARLTGDFTYAPLAGTLPATQAVVAVGDTTGTFTRTTLAVNHLAVRYVALSHGADPTAPCYAATLTIKVEIPYGVTSSPHYYANTKGATAQALTVNGSSASITVPWNTCASSPPAYVSLPNGSLNLDGREFIVTGTVTVDRNAPASPSEPPAPVTVIGGVINAPTSDPAPTLRLYAPEVLRVSAKTRLLRFAVFSSGDGKLQAALGSTSLGTASLRGGNNDVRFVLPQQLFKSLRTKSSSNLLQLTSMSPSGTKGASFTRRVVVQAAKKPKRQR
jgi:hypothetical protein